MLRHFVCFVLLCLACMSVPVNAQSSDSAWCTQKIAETVRSTRYTKCGFWNWGRCTVVSYKTVYKTEQICCPGYVEPDCTKVPEEPPEEEDVTRCPYTNPKKASVCSDGTRLCRDKICDESGFKAPVEPVPIHENNNDEQLLWSTEGTSFVRYKKGKNKKKYSSNVPSTECEVSSTNEIAAVQNGTMIYRKKCMNPLCNPCGIEHEGCLDNDVEYSVKVSCFAPGYNINTGRITHTFKITATKAEKLEFDLPEEFANCGQGVYNTNDVSGNAFLENTYVPNVYLFKNYEEFKSVLLDHSLELLTSSVNEGDEILTLENLQIPANEYVVFFLHGPPSVNNPLQPLFNLTWDQATRNLHVFVESALTLEPAGTHPVELCAWQRRDMTCHSFNVTLVHLTTTTTTTSTTTTTTATTTLPRPKPRCRARDAWANVPGHHQWCEVMCDVTDCESHYPDHCVCEDFNYVQKVCTSEGSWKSNHLDDWCMLNCNYGAFSFCPTEDEFPSGFCVCEELTTSTSPLPLW